MSQPVSSRWYPTLNGSHNRAIQFEVYNAGGSLPLYQSPVIVNPGAKFPIIIGTTDRPTPGVTGGTVTMEKQSDTRTRFTMNLYDPTGFLINDGVLSCWGNEMKIYSGLAYSDGTYELVCLGTFRITDVDAEDSGNGVEITVSGQDRSRIVSRAKVVQFYQTAPNAPYTDAIRAMVQYAYPSVVFNDSGPNWYKVPPAGIGVQNGSNPQMIYTPDVYGITYQEGEDLWMQARLMAQALTCDLYFDRQGICRLVQDPNLDYMNGSLLTIPPPVVQFVEGEDAIFTKAGLKQSDRNAYNQWVIYGEGQILGYTQAPIRSLPTSDNDPSSPTYINGPYGTVTGFETNQLMVTQNQINSYANFKLATSSGKLQTIQLTAFVDSSLDVDDPVGITRERVGLSNQLFILDTLQIPLTVKDLMTIQSRERRAFIYGA